MLLEDAGAKRGCTILLIAASRGPWAGRWRRSFLKKGWDVVGDGSGGVWSKRSFTSLPTSFQGTAAGRDRGTSAKRLRWTLYGRGSRGACFEMLFVNAGTTTPRGDGGRSER